VECHLDDVTAPLPKVLAVTERHQEQGIQAAVDQEKPETAHVRSVRDRDESPAKDKTRESHREVVNESDSDLDEGPSAVEMKVRAGDD
ncbi:hypothetical protein NDU88_010999, partial [Pleurodeles waltl]